MTSDQEIDRLLSEVTLKKELEENGYIHRDSLLSLILEQARVRFEKLCEETA